MFLLTLNMGSTCYILRLPVGTTGMLTVRNSPRKHKDLILALLEAVQLPTQVALIHCRGHRGGWVLCECRGQQRDGFFVSQGMRKADQMAKQAAGFQDPEHVMTLVL